MTVYRRRQIDIAVPLRGMMALAVLALVSSVFAAEPPAPLPKSEPIRITPIAPAAVPVSGAAAMKVSQQPSPQAAPQPAAQPAAPADPNEAVRQALRERMAGSGDLVIRSTDSIPPPAPRAAAPAAKAAPKPAAGRPVAVAPWDYDGERGPQAWAKLHPTYAQCEKGRFQSPIDLRDGVGVDLPPISFEFKPSLFKVTDTGKTLELAYNNGGSFSVLGNVYRLSHIEFRHPAEERINGRTHGMSMQMHFRDAQGRMAAVSVLLNPAGKEHAFIQTVWNHIPLLRNEPVAPPDVMLDLAKALPRDLSYYTYMGSLTAPPCTE
ncbi:MAG: hypothetical protein RI937_1341, partial [Pseudomonadota bacterium]